MDGLFVIIAIFAGPPGLAILALWLLFGGKSSPQPIFDGATLRAAEDSIAREEREARAALIEAVRCRCPRLPRLRARLDNAGSPGQRAPWGQPSPRTARPWSP